MSFHTIAAAHRVPLPIPADQAIGQVDPAIIRYDGMMKGDMPVIQAVIRLQDLARLDAEVLADLNLQPGSRAIDETAFFVKGKQSVTLHVDVDAHEDFLVKFNDACEDRDIPVIAGAGDLRLLVGATETKVLPDRAAWQENGEQPISVSKAMALLMQMRIADHITQSLSEGPAEAPDHDVSSLYPER